MTVVRLLAVLSLLCLACLPLAAAPPQHLPQNWSATDWDWFYTTPQGSKLIQYKWARALERPDSETLFLADGLARFGYLPNAVSRDNPDGLPVGFVKDSTHFAEHLGMTCAACHTNQINYRGTTWQIDGAPTDADLFGFLAELSESLSVTSAAPDDPKFLRFARRVGANNARARQKLYRELRSFAAYFAAFVHATKSPYPWGPARADAFGAIFNRVTAIDLHIPSNNRPPNAPVSYPFLWDISWHNLVQWNGSAPNGLAILRLARNVGEVLGVFAEIDIRKPGGLHWYYASTANRINLLEIEDRLATLRSPKWPDALPPIDAARRDRGQVLYARHCESCHKIATPGKFQDVVMTPLDQIGTDPTMAVNAAQRTAKTGVLEGVKSFVIAGEPFGETAGAGAITLNAVLGAILSPIPSDWYRGTPPKSQTRTASAATATRTGEGSEHDLRNDLFSREHTANDKIAESATTKSDPVRQDLERALVELGLASPKELAYKARPLDGIWATAPYLHNGSVPSLRALLLPAAQRPVTFRVGSRELDPVNVGFTDDGPFVLDTRLPGNSNAGHEYGNFSASEIDDLVEYLKSL